MRLRDLDDRVLPVLAARLRRLTGARPAGPPPARGPARTADASHPRPAATTAGARRGQPQPAGQPADAGCRGPDPGPPPPRWPPRPGRPSARLLLPAGLVLAVVAAGVVFAVHVTYRPGAGAAGSPGNAALGPTGGEQVSDYLAAARTRLQVLQHSHPDQATFAVADFTGYQAAAWVLAVVGSLPALRGYFRAAVPGLVTPVHAVSLGGLAELPALIVADGQHAQAAAVGFAQALRSLGPHPPAQLVATLRRQQAIAAAEARVLDGTCDCVFAVVVYAEPAQLARLAATPGVRAVDPAPPSVPLSGLAATPLLPDLTGQVPGGGLPTGVSTVP